LDTEWLLSTLFDASLLLTLAAGNGGFFSPGSQGCGGVGNHISRLPVALLDSRQPAGNDLFIISRLGLGWSGWVRAWRATATP